MSSEGEDSSERVDAKGVGGAFFLYAPIEWQRAHHNHTQTNRVSVGGVFSAFVMDFGMPLAQEKNGQSR